MAFVEDKQPDFANAARHLAASATGNRWTNFGPAWSALKKQIEQMLALPADRAAVPCASGTHALMAAAAAAFILDRLEHAPASIAGYRSRFERIVTIAERIVTIAQRHQFCHLVDPRSIGEAMPANVPRLAPGPICEAATENELVADRWPASCH